jgi:DNA-binding transcriptional regulator YiaG
MRQAARAVRKSRQTLYRYVKDGKLSVTSTKDGEKRVDTAELLRVFGELHHETDTATVISDHARQPAVEALQAQLAATETALRFAREQLELAQQEKARLLGVVETQARMLEDKREKQTQASPRGWWARVLGQN